MSNNFLNETQFRVHVASMQRRFEKVASIDPTEVSERLLADEEFRQKVMEAIAAVEFQLASNDQYGIAKGQRNDSPETWHRVSFNNGLGSINREGLEAFIRSLVGSGGGSGGGTGGGGITYQDILRILGDIRLFGPDGLPVATNTGGHLTIQQGTPEQYGVCKPRKNSPCYPQQTGWQTMDGALVAETKHDIHMFAPFSFPRETQPRINFFDRLTFIPINAQERCEARKKCCSCEGGGSGTNKSFVKDFTFDVKQTVPFTKDFTATAVVDSPLVWTTRKVSPVGWRSITYGNGLFVAVGHHSSWGTGVSSDGIDWTVGSVPYGNECRSITYGNGLFVAVGDNCVMTSPDGINWTAQTALAGNWSSITYGNGLFVAVGWNGGVMTSPNGINWTARTAPTGNWSFVTYGNGLYVAVGLSGSVMTSPDGMNWTNRQLAANSEWYHITYGNGLFVALAIFNNTTQYLYVMTSPDGITWTERHKIPHGVVDGDAITYGNGLFVAFTPQYTTLSYDGITWESFKSLTLRDRSLSDMTYGDERFVAISTEGNVMTALFPKNSTTL